MEPALRPWNRCCILRTNDHFIDIIDSIRLIAIMIIINLMRNQIERAIGGLAGFLLGDARSWEASFTVGVAIFGISCYCLKACVETVRAQLLRGIRSTDKEGL
ncbi:hypothetical protein DCAR_0933510 [Daucus carota subsp. sativus]|uniref:Uncharacterized protein n=1 Tax=Daucus carota subsp. sativus TaxID=79200 RepID=A0AAF0XTR7_DAUCS|nr:PREDICTED: uncharacterized protein LOC108202017 [Daucus carota subsp. sativus]WOH13995.1 hypothetical protein DCAR_0933510 [Daucus carota subsp. sativus]